MKHIKNYVIIMLLLLCTVVWAKKNNAFESDLQALPHDTGGTHTRYKRETTNAPYNFYLYTPGGYNKSDAQYPLLIFLHGAGETEINAPNLDLSILLRHGPTKLINKGSWHPKYPMIVASPRAKTGWNAETVHQFISYLIKKYRVNTKRIYMSGISMGSIGTFEYCIKKGNDAYVAAVVPIAGGHWLNGAPMKHIPCWAFHGDGDTAVNVSHSINIINSINASKPPIKAKLTIYPGINHIKSWQITYTGAGMTIKTDKNWAPFNSDVFSWLLSHKKE